MAQGLVHIYIYICFHTDNRHRLFLSLVSLSTCTSLSEYIYIYTYTHTPKYHGIVLTLVALSICMCLPVGRNHAVYMIGALIYIYIYMCVSFRTPEMSSSLSYAPRKLARQKSGLTQRFARVGTRWPPLFLASLVRATTQTPQPRARLTSGLPRTFRGVPSVPSKRISPFALLSRTCPFNGPRALALKDITKTGQALADGQAARHSVKKR